jgi:hypothetical protein
MESRFGTSFCPKLHPNRTAPIELGYGGRLLSPKPRPKDLQIALLASMIQSCSEATIKLCAQRQLLAPVAPAVTFRRAIAAITQKAATTSAGSVYVCPI